MSIELWLLVASALFFVSILADKAGYRFGVPTLLLFLFVGMLFGVDGLGIDFSDTAFASNLGTVALCIILFSGGMDTRFNDIKPVVAQGVVLATLGVLLTALATGGIVWFILNTYHIHSLAVSGGASVLTAMLLASTMSSTDSASVFSILRSKGLQLKYNLRPMLELESGSNDPMAYVLTTTLIGILSTEGEAEVLQAIVTVIVQLLVGAAVGYVAGLLMVKAINHLHIHNDSLYPIFVLTGCVFVFASTYFLQGNSYLAVYIAGLVVGNSKFVHKRTTLRFFDGLTWLSQLAMFLTLGLLVVPHELVEVIVPALIVSVVMIFVTRPLSVFISLAPFKGLTVKSKMFVSWVGLRGAVPIIFAIMALAANVPQAKVLFNIVFFCTLISLIVQGTSLPFVAKLLKVALEEEEMPQKKLTSFEIDLPEDARTMQSELEVTPAMLENGNRLMDIDLPERKLVIMVKRADRYFVPKGNTELEVGDRMLIISDEN